MKLLIALQHRLELWNAPDWFVPRLHEEFPDLAITYLKNYDRIEQEIPDAEIAVTWSLRLLCSAWLTRARAIDDLLHPAAVSHI